jgi:hypothetical protein
MKFFKTLDLFFEKQWRITNEAIVYLFNIKQDEDIDWLNMHNNMVDNKIVNSKEKK